MSMHLNHLHALEQTGGAVWRRYCQLRDQAGLPGSSSALEYQAFCALWQEHPGRLKEECERLEQPEGETTEAPPEPLPAETASKKEDFFDTEVGTGPVAERDRPCNDDHHPA